jgi:hypothetical protein
VLLALGQVNEARTMLQDIGRRIPAAPPRARAYLALGDLDGARECVRTRAGHTERPGGPVRTRGGVALRRADRAAQR